MKRRKKIYKGDCFFFSSYFSLCCFVFPLMLLFVLSKLRTDGNGDNKYILRNRIWVSLSLDYLEMVCVGTLSAPPVKHLFGNI